MPGGAAFVEGLRAMIDAGRAFGRHPVWRRLAEGRLPRPALRPFAVQFFLQVREFPRAVSALHSSCPDTRERIELAESLYEERSEEHTSELQSRLHLVCRLLLEKKKKKP